MNEKKNLLFYTNNRQCVSLPKNEKCSYLRIDNYLSEYLTELEKQLVLENLGITEKVDQLYTLLNNKLNLYATLKFLDDNYVKKIDLYYPEEEDDSDGFEPVSFTGGEGSGFGWTVDDFLSLTSINPVLNRIITAALNQKADISMLENYASIDYLSLYLTNYQRLLRAGFGIRIEGDTISTTLDLNPFIFVDELPATGDPNKIYLTPDKTTPGYYIQYHYDVDKRKWIEIGRVSIQSTLGGFLTLEEADARYLKKGELPQSVAQTIINNVKQLLGNYVKKSEVYTPDLWGNDSTSGQINDDDNNGGSGNIIDWGNYVNITVDTALDSRSLNPVTNRAIKLALDAKLDKLTTLNAGNGIRIDEDSVISCTFDTSIYRFVTVLPTTGDSSKIYLLKREGTIYKQYVYENGRWLYIGDIDLAIDITGYLSKQEASLLYMTKLELATTYLTKTEFSDYFAQMLSGGSSIDGSVFATKEYVNNLIANIDKDALDALAQFKLSDYLEFMTTLAAKANTSDVYTKTLADSLFQKKGDYVYRTDFTSSIATLTNKVDSFTIDETLSAISEHAVQNKIVYREFLKYLTSSLASETYATKSDLESVTITLKTINGQSLLGTGNIQINMPVDSTVSENSVNAVSSRAVYQYINQNLLTPGTGINIQNGVISVTLDAINPFIITDTKPSLGQANKIYLIKEQSGYRQWTYENSQWNDKGLLDLSVDLSNYVTNNDVTDLRTWINDTFVKKEDIYTPDLDDTASQDITEQSSSSSGESSEPILPPSSSGTSGGSVYFTTSLPDGVKTNIAVGNIAANTDISVLRGLSFSEIVTRMLFKETYNNPQYRHYISIDVAQTIAKVGDVMETPTVVTNWNTNIIPQQTITSNITVRKNNSTSAPFQPGSIYNEAGTYVFVLNYSYPEGHYDITSNFGNTRLYTVDAFSGAMTKTVKVTYPWFINNVEQTPLVPIGENYTKEIFLNGNPKVSIPGANSVCTIQADLGLGYMDTTWTKSTEVRNGITYSVWTKPDSYSQDVKHKITFNIYL